MWRTDQGDGEVNIQCKVLLCTESQVRSPLLSLPPNSNPLPRNNIGLIETGCYMFGTWETHFINLILGFSFLERGRHAFLMVSPVKTSRHLYMQP